MAIVKILSNSKGFSAVEYNFERKEKGEAELIAKQNFPLKGNFNDYGFRNEKEFIISQLDRWGMVNRSVKNKQFHVTISAEGKSLTKKQLHAIGEAWLNRMGYGQNPYLIFFHNNTNNNHIHIVTSRLDSKGKKINDSMEKVRAVKVLEEIMGVDRKKELNEKVETYLNFSFENANQFLSLLEQDGYSYNHDKKNNTYNIYKNKLFVCSIAASRLEGKYKKFDLNRDVNVKKLRAILIKYAKSARNIDELNLILKQKFGISLVMYGKNDSFYGYNIIDYKNKAVFKGGKILNVKLLEKLIQENFENINANELIKDILERNKIANTRTINQEIRNFGFRIKDNYIVDMATGIIKSELDENIASQINYNDRLSRCNNTFKPVTIGECNWVARHYNLAVEDFETFKEQNKAKRKDELEYYSSLFSSCIDEKTLKEFLDAHEIRCVKECDEMLFVDFENKKVFSADSLNLDLSQTELKNESIFTKASLAQESSGGDSDTRATDILFSSLNTSSISMNVGGGGSTDTNKKDKKKKPKR